MMYDVPFAENLENFWTNLSRKVVRGISVCSGTPTNLARHALKKMEKMSRELSVTKEIR